MKKALIAIVLLLIVIASHSQTSNVLVKEKTIGRITSTQEEIKANEYIFSERIYHSYIDTISKSITVQLRGLSNNGKWMNKGKVIFYDLNTKKVRWSKNIDYQKNSLQQFGSTIIFTVGNKSYRLNNENGEKLWMSRNDIYFIDTVAGIGVGYKFESIKGRYDNLLEGIDLETGKTKWKRELNEEYGWNDVIKLTDSVWMIVAAGLHTVNIYDGTGWSYKTVTGDKYYNETAAASAAGVVLGVFTGVFMISTGNYILRDVVSNVYSDSADFYFASREKLSRINKDNGKAIWSYPFSAKLPSKSFLFANENQLFMINYGYAFKGIGLSSYGVSYDGYNRMELRQWKSPVNYGTPFFAAFNKENGEQIFCTTLDKESPIFDFMIEDDNLLLVLNDRIVKFSISDGGKIFEKIMNNDELESFIDDYIHIDGGKIGDYKLAFKNNQTIIVDADNKKVAELYIARKAVLIGNKLYTIQEESFLEIDVTNLIK